MKKALLAVLLPFIIVASGALGYHYWDTGALPGMLPEFVPVTVQDISAENRGVRIHGTAHYPVRLHQVVEGGERWLIFPLMSPGDTLSREIKVIVRVDHEPEALVSYEDLEVDGLARPAGGRVGPKVIDRLRGEGYTFAEKVIFVEGVATRAKYHEAE
jgi:hypothetical protein